MNITAEDWKKFFKNLKNKKKKKKISNKKKKA